jgi:hypothetical protein
VAHKDRYFTGLDNCLSAGGEWISEVEMSAVVRNAMIAVIITSVSVFALATPAFAVTKVDQAGINTILAKHNSARDEVGVAHIGWDDGLANDAQAYADKLAAQDSQSPNHDTKELATLNEGENLAWSFGTPPIQFALDFWYGEKQYYDADPNKKVDLAHAVYDPDPAKRTNYYRWGHYTQMVWSTTTRVGCGIATGASGRNYVSCRYRPPGNVDGQLAYPGANGALSTAVYLSDGSRFPGWTQWSLRDGGWIDAARWVAGDFNGDGKADVAAIWNNGGTNTLTVSQATGSQSTGTGFTRSHWATNAGGWIDSTAWLAGDFNGDGKSDLAASWNNTQ